MSGFPKYMAGAQGFEIYEDGVPVLRPARGLNFAPGMTTPDPQTGLVAITGGGGGGVESVAGGEGVVVDNADPLNPVVSAPGAILTASATLTNAEILALPTTQGPVLVPAPGAGRIVMPVWMLWLLTRASGFGYGNLNASASCGLTYSSAVGSSVGPVDMVMRQTGALIFGGGVTTNPTMIRIGTGDNLTNGMASTARAGIENQPLRAVLHNHTGGDLTGGNAANTLKIMVGYVVVDIS